MGLIRVTGGSEGVKEYLENGEKQGREQTRDELDERVVLSGDLEIVDRIVSEMTNEGDKYLHITHSFKEDSLPIEVLQNLSNEVEEFFLAGYKKEEYCYYSEVHLPKIKSLIDQVTGDEKIRVVHFHAIIPKINLATGMSLNPVGLYKQNIEWFHAFQEHINRKYGLASPDDNKRMKFTDSSEIISGRKGITFTGRGDDLKLKILSAVIERNIRTPDKFRELLTEFGDVKTKNYGRANESFNVKVPRSIKGTDLLDEVFKPKFIRLTDNQKRTFLIEKFGHKDIDGAQSGSHEEQLAAALTGWRESIAGSHEQRKDLKSQIRNAILDRDIRSVDAFREMLKEFGQAKTRNAGRTDEYENIKPTGNVKGINLKDFEFSKGFLELPLEAKRAHINKSEVMKFEAQGDARETPEELLAKVEEWKCIRCKEIKYLNSGNKKTYAEYQNSTPEQKLEFLQDRERRHDWRLEQIANASKPTASSTADASIGDDDGQHDDDYGYHPATIDSISTARQIDCLSNLSSSYLASDGETAGGEVFLQNASRVLVPFEQGNELNNDMRRVGESTGRSGHQGGNPRAENAETGRRSDNVIGQMLRDFKEGTVTAAADIQPDIAEIKTRLDARSLLNVLSKTHGLVIEKYSITKAKDGSDRIKAGNNNYPVNDFLTKEMHLSWKDAEKILRTEYAKQQLIIVEANPRQQPKKVLWAEFQKLRPILSKEAKDQQWADQKTSEVTRRRELKTDYDEKRARIRADKSLRPAERKASLSLVRMKKIELDQYLKDTITNEHEELKANQRRPTQEQYREWLVKLAENNERALQELRRMNIEPLEASSAKLEASGGGSLGNPIHKSDQLSHYIHRNGDVTYERHGIPVIRDTYKSVQMYETSDQDIETGLRLALAKFGSKLTLTGDSEFQRRAAEIAAEQNLRIEFVDPVLNDIMQERHFEIDAKREAERESRALAHDFIKSRENPIAPAPVPKIVRREDGPVVDERKANEPVATERRKSAPAKAKRREDDSAREKKPTHKPYSM